MEERVSLYKIQHFYYILYCRAYQYKCANPNIALERNVRAYIVIAYIKTLTTLALLEDGSMSDGRIIQEYEI